MAELEVTIFGNCFMRVKGQEGLYVKMNAPSVLMDHEFEEQELYRKLIFSDGGAIMQIEYYLHLDRATYILECMGDDEDDPRRLLCDTWHWYMNNKDTINRDLLETLPPIPIKYEVHDE
jgi:hypothetical protein